MANNTNKLLIGAAVLVGGYFLYKNYQQGTTSKMDDEDLTENEKKADVVIDTEKENLSVPDAIDRARSVAQDLRDAAILIKTPTGQDNISVSTGVKRGLLKRPKKGGKITREMMKQIRANATKYCANKKKKAQRNKCRRQFVKAAKLRPDKLAQSLFM